MTPILVTGSIAYDTIMVFPDRFRNHLLADQLHILNVCFLTPQMRREFGGTAGLVTMEDLLEEIVGQIYDEYDRPDASPTGTATVLAPVMSGSTEVADVNRNYGLQLDDTDYTTIGGVVFGKLGRLPRVGDRVELPGATFEVIEMEGRRVGKVRVTLARPASTA